MEDSIDITRHSIRQGGTRLVIMGSLRNNINHLLVLNLLLLDDDDDDIIIHLPIVLPMINVINMHIMLFIDEDIFCCCCC